MSHTCYPYRLIHMPLGIHITFAACVSQLYIFPEITLHFNVISNNEDFSLVPVLCTGQLGAGQ